VISADSPMGQTLLELEEDDEVFFRNTQMIILLIE
jgi:transcription elongation GreA/GreB family factor